MRPKFIIQLFLCWNKIIYKILPPLFLERQNNYRVAVLMFATQDNCKIKSQLKTSFNIGLDPILLLAGTKIKI
jgi:hypothetical protein